MTETLDTLLKISLVIFDKGIVLGADQSAKTKTSLEFFSAQLQQETAARPSLPL